MTAFFTKKNIGILRSAYRVRLEGRMGAIAAKKTARPCCHGRAVL
jgi:hypothetical protein